MKLPYLLLIPFTFPLFCQGQNKVHMPGYIDSLQNARQIEALITSIDKGYESFKVNERLQFSDTACQHLSDSLEIKPWTKADFDHNGLTDILVVGNWYSHWVVCVLDKGDSKFELIPVTRRAFGFQECSFPLVVSQNGTNMIRYFFQNYPEKGKEDKPRTLEHIDLVYRFGNFIEFNPKPSAHKIRKITFETTRCYGPCPIFKMTVKQNGSAVWDAQGYNKVNEKDIEGVFRTSIDKQQLTELFDLLNYLNFDQLRDNYAVYWPEDQTCTLKIVFDNGKIKTITDYGLLGTYGLNRVYDLIFALRENQNWR